MIILIFFGRMAKFIFILVHPLRVSSDKPFLLPIIRTWQAVSLLEGKEEPNIDGAIVYLVLTFYINSFNRTNWTRPEIICNIIEAFLR